MSDKFRNKYRIPSARLRNWDYGSNAKYFITICTQNRECYFGEIRNGEMRLSEIGKIVEYEWLKTPGIRLDMNLQMGKFVIMPDHFHAIIGIGKNRYNTNRDAMHRVSILNKFGPQSKNLASVIRGFKSSVTISARKIDTGFTWQSSFYDHVIRDRGSFQRISDYILENPGKWQKS
jgi:REP element-mobilizing transposase RayT